MIETKIAGSDIKVPENWNELEYWQGAGLLNAYVVQEDNFTQTLRLLSILINKPIDWVEELSPEETGALLDMVWFDNDGWLTDPPNISEPFPAGATPIPLPMFGTEMVLIEKPITSEVLRYFTAKRVVQGLADDMGKSVEATCKLIACYIDKGEFNDSQVDILAEKIKHQPFTLVARMGFFCLLDLSKCMSKKKELLQDYPKQPQNNQAPVLKTLESSTP